MTDEQRAEFTKQAAIWRGRADRQRGVISHVKWDGQHMEATITRPERAAGTAEAPKSGRGVFQGQLI